MQIKKVISITFEPLQAKGTWNKKLPRVKNGNICIIHGRLGVLRSRGKKENSKSLRRWEEVSDYGYGDSYQQYTFGK